VTRRNIPWRAQGDTPSLRVRRFLDGVGGRHEGRLRDIFARFDTSGDGYLDAHELKLALRFVTGEDLGLEICERIVRAMDTDGDGVIDFHEFKAALASR
jgi:Ca2+-binding EF-hand superfamily protein